MNVTGVECKHCGKMLERGVLNGFWLDPSTSKWCSARDDKKDGRYLHKPVKA